MAKPERYLNLALAHLRRPAWPKGTLPDFGTTPIPPMVESRLLTADEAVRLGLVAAHRSTCELSPERFDRFAAMEGGRTLAIHAIDAEPGVPLLAFWAAKQVPALQDFATRARQELGCDVLFALPADLPDALRKTLAPLKPARFVDWNYPGGHWRLLPAGCRLPDTRTLVIDVIAATDWTQAILTGQAAPERPVAVASEKHLDFRTVPRGTSAPSLLTDSGPDDAIWFAGPRLTDHVVHDPIGDGELTFYREPLGDRSSSPCIRCGNCIAVCPTRVDPVALLREHVSGSVREKAVTRAGIDSCIDCGLCTSVCPAGIELHHMIADLKAVRRHSLALAGLAVEQAHV